MSSETKIFNIGDTDTAVASAAVGKKLVVQDLSVSNVGSYLPNEFAPVTGERPKHIGTMWQETHQNSLFYHGCETLNMSDTLSIVKFCDFSSSTTGARIYVQAVEYDAANKCTYSGPAVYIGSYQANYLPDGLHMGKAGATKFVMTSCRTSSRICSYKVDPVTLIITPISSTAGPSGYSAGYVPGRFSAAYVSEGKVLAHIYGTSSGLYEVGVPDSGDLTFTLLQDKGSNKHGYMVRAHDTDLSFAHMYAEGNGDFRMALFDYTENDQSMSSTTYTQYVESNANSSGQFWNLVELRDDGTYGFAWNIVSTQSSYPVRLTVFSDKTGSNLTQTILASATTNLFPSIKRCGPGMYIYTLSGSSPASYGVAHRVKRNGTAADIDQVSAGQFNAHRVKVGFKDVVLGQHNKGAADYLCTKDASTLDQNGVFLNVGRYNGSRIRWSASLGRYVVCKNNCIYALDADLIPRGSVLAKSTGYAGHKIDIWQDDDTNVLVTFYQNQYLYTVSQENNTYFDKFKVPTSFNEAYSAEWSLQAMHNNNYGAQGSNIQPMCFPGGSWVIIGYFRYSSNYWYTAFGGTGGTWTNSGSDMSNIRYTTTSGYGRPCDHAAIRVGTDAIIDGYLLSGNNTRIDRNDNVSPAQNTTSGRSNLKGNGAANGVTHYDQFTRDGMASLWHGHGGAHCLNINAPSNYHFWNTATANDYYGNAFFLQGTTPYVATADQANGYRLWKVGATLEQVTQVAYAAGDDIKYSPMFGWPDTGVNYFSPDGVTVNRVFGVVPGTRTVELSKTGDGQTKSFTLVNGQQIAVGEVFKLDAGTVITPGEQLRLKADAAGAIQAMATTIEASD
ncbi:hypothetical protein [Roseibium sp.]|uniref:hypothetical protein n=1 Tax=Roseibium sp. TaxID=1936156 RepID=UPI003B523EF9